jgi:multiple sugar transport system substrate-binding protein
LGAAITFATLFAAAACGSPNPAGNGGDTGKYGFAAAEQSDGKLVVWVDSTRLDAAKAYQKAHPKAQLDIVTYDGNANGSNTLKTKTQLFDRAHEGWPDVVFTTDNNTASWASQGDDAFVAPLSEGLLDKSTLDGFAPGALDVCTVDGKVYCLRNDLAQVVLWYNKTPPRPVRLHRAEDLGGVRDARREGRDRAPRVPHRHRG